MRNRKGRGYRHRSNDRRHQSRSNGVDKMRFRTNTFSQNRSRNSFISQQGAEKLAERYSAMAKEALSSGDKIASENFLQHADHFMRIIVSKNENKNLNEQKPNNSEQVINNNEQVINNKEPVKTDNNLNQTQPTEQDHSKETK